MRSFREKPIGWRQESYRHYLAAKGISTKQRYFMATFKHLPQYQLKEIARVHGEEAAKEARERAITEHLSAKQLAELYGVEYKRRMRGEGPQGISEAVVEPLHQEKRMQMPFDPREMVRRRLEQKGRQLFEQRSEEIEQAKQRLLELRNKENEATLDINRAASPFEYDQAVRAVKAFDAAIKMRDMEQERLQRRVEEGGYASLVPEEEREMRMRLPKGQVRLEEFGVPGYGELQHRVSEYMARKFKDVMRPADTAVVPEGKGWIAEKKYDGTRMLAYIEDGKVRLINRRGADKTETFPELERELKREVQGSAVLDGEVVAFRHGRDDFKALAERDHLQDKGKIAIAMKKQPVDYVVFDVLRKGGKDVRQEPLSERRRVLDSIIDTRGRVRRAQQTTVEKARKAKVEGIVFKEKDAPYQEGKSRDWLKYKFRKEADVVVTGYEPGKGRREGYIGALKIGVQKKGDGIRQVGKVGTGFTDEDLKILTPKAKSGKPFVIRVKYLKEGSRGALREPSFIAERMDIAPSQTHM